MLNAQFKFIFYSALFLQLFCGSPRLTFADTIAEEQTHAVSKKLLEYQLLNFRISQISVFVGSGSSFSGDLSWNPKIWITSKMGIVGNFGSAPLLSSQRTVFHTLHYELLAFYDLSSTWGGELGVGGQTWFETKSTTGVAVSVNGSYVLKNKWFGLFDRFILGYSYFMAALPTHEAKLGVQVSF